MYFQDLLENFVNVCINILDKQLVGIYLHGSLAMGCFHPEKSDIDLIVVIEESITYNQKLQLMNQIVKLNKKGPIKGLEISVVRKEVCLHFVYPTPYELHFSPMHLQCFQNNPNDYIYKMKSVDVDLAAHFTSIRKYGIVLYGQEVTEVFGEIPVDNFVDSLWNDIKDAKRDICSEPVYIVLNLCRFLAFLQDGLYLSKETGGQWGIMNLDKKYHAMLLQAMNCYETNQEYKIDKCLEEQFVDEMLLEITDAIKSFDDNSRCFNTR